MSRSGHVRIKAFAVGLLFFLMLGISSSRAKLPEVDAVYYGSLLHEGGEPLAPQSSGEISVVARQSGVTIAEAAVPAGVSNYVLKVPRDDGQDPRLPGTSRAGEKVRVYLRNNQSGAEFEASESSSSSGFQIASTRSSVTSANLSVPQSLGGMSKMALWLSAFSLPTVQPQTTDSDGDGLTDSQEFTAMTDPTKSGERFQILEVTKNNGVNFIRFGPIRAVRQYLVWSTSDLASGTWSKVGTLSPGYDAADFWFGHPAAASDRFFYRLEVTAP